MDASQVLLVDYAQDSPIGIVVWDRRLLQPRAIRILEEVMAWGDALVHIVNINSSGALLGLNEPESGGKKRYLACLQLPYG